MKTRRSTFITLASSIVANTLAFGPTQRWASSAIAKSRAGTRERVSSRDQEREGYSIPAQQKLLRKYAKDEGITIVHEFQDVETAKKAGRPGLKEMIKFLKKSRTCKAVLFEKTDRAYRNWRDWVTLDELDLNLHFVKENEVISQNSTSNAKLIHSIKVAMAKHYTDNLSEEVKKGLLEKAEQGIYPKPAPTGYMNVTRDDGKKVIKPDPAMAPIVTKMFKRYATGNHSLLDITKWAADQGLKTPRAKKPPTKSSVHRIFCNLIYIGDFEFGGKTYKGIHEPLVSRKLWDNVQIVLGNKSAQKPGKTKHDYAFSRLITCGHCGGLLVAEKKKGRYIYYHCTRYKGKCPEPYVREETLARKFDEVVKGINLDKEVHKVMVDALHVSHDDTKTYHEEALSRLQHEHNRMQNRLDQAYEDKLDGKITTAFFERKADEWNSEQTRILRKIEEHQQAKRHYYKEGILLLELSSKAYQLYVSRTPVEKREFLDFLLSNSVWKNGELTVTYRTPFNIIAEMAAEQTRKKAAGDVSNGLSPVQRGGRDSNPRPPA